MFSRIKRFIFNQSNNDQGGKHPHSDDIDFLLTPLSKEETEYNLSLNRERIGQNALITHAKLLASESEVSFEKSRWKGAENRLNHAFNQLEISYLYLSQVEQEKLDLATGSQWIIDNFHLIEQHYKEANLFFQYELDKLLPKLTNGPHKGTPRIYQLAYDLIFHVDGLVTEELIVRYISSYQKGKTLSMRELWAFPIMLRIIILENLSFLAEFNVVTRKQKNQAREAVDKLFKDKKLSPSKMVISFNHLMKRKPQLSLIGNIVSLVQVLRSYGSKALLCLQWLDQLIEESHYSCNTLIEAVLHKHSANQISIANSFASLRLLTIIDWKSWFEQTSKVHEILSCDPSGTYSLSDFRTRDRCRQKIETIAKSLKIEEQVVSEKVLIFTQEYFTREDASVDESVKKVVQSAGICYFLLDEGLFEAAKEIGYRRSFYALAGRWINKRLFSFWMYSFVVLLLAVLAVPALFFYSLGYSLSAIGLISLFLALLGSQIAIETLQWGATHIKVPEPLAKLDFEKKISDCSKTLVLVHTILVDHEQIKEQIEELEVHYFSNRDENLHFALAADFPASHVKKEENDDELIAYAEELMRGLGQQYPSKFFLVVRERVWSPSENCFISWERKRGKIHQINRVILGGEAEGLLLVYGDRAALHSIKYVITLDEDTRIPPGQAQKMVATIDHPLNRPILNEEKATVARGYGIVQPVIETTMRSASSTKFSSIFSSGAGLDPYSNVNSEMGQDLFHEGSYYGKGVYDVATFERVLSERIPEERVLSHDLLEGLFVGAGLASDLHLFDEQPGNFITYIKRLQRWIRGDWQLLPWVFSKIPNVRKGFEKTIISPLGRWKIIDNLRRSLLLPSCFLVIVASWLGLPESPWIWISFALLSIHFSVVTSFLDIFIYAIRNYRVASEKVLVHGANWGRQLAEWLVYIVLIPSLTFKILYAIGVTLYRLCISKKNLLQWETSSFVQRTNGHSIASLYKLMFGEVFLTALIFCGMLIFESPHIYHALPFLTVWMFSPPLIYLLGQPKKSGHYLASEVEEKTLKKVAWDTWRFFDKNITEKNNFLICDNLQIVPKPVVAPRTSPTNIGFQFLSTVSALDFGFIFFPKVIQDFEKTFSTIDRMEKFNGHLYNWYNIETLAPLYPRYVSSVDSGNFVSHLITTCSFLKSFGESPVVSEAHWNHLQFLLQLLGHKVTSTPKNLFEFVKEVGHLKAFIGELRGKRSKVFELMHQGMSEETVFDAIISVEAYIEFADMLHVIEYMGNIKSSSFKDSIQYEQLMQVVSELRKEAFPDWNHLKKELHRTLHLLGETEIKAEVQRVSHWINQLFDSNHCLIEKISECIKGTDFTFLFSKKEGLLSIGYQVEHNTLDPNFYNLIASESVVTSLVAIALGQLPSKHWFKLQRPLIQTPVGKTLLSWSGSTFEYLMPFILFRLVPDTLLYKGYQVSVKAQQYYGKQYGLPWGISESGYAVTDVDGNFQYRAFGVSYLGLKRGLENDYVVSPYSSFLSLPLDPKGTLLNIRELESEGARGEYGFFESIDYTPSRLSLGEKCYVLQSYLAHHQGMILTSINNFLNGGLLQERFHDCAFIRSMDLLLEEPFPYYRKTVNPLLGKDLSGSHQDETQVPKEDRVTTPNTRFPRTHVLSNGKFGLMMENAGSGYLFYEGGIAVTRWQEDLIHNNLGSYIFIRDLDTGDFWSLGYQPTRVSPKHYEVIYSPEKIEIRREDFGISLHGEITISPENNAEIRSLTLKNETNRKRRLEVTSYGEVVLNTLRADAAHPAFSKMFIDSDYDKKHGALVFHRRGSDIELFLSHMLVSCRCWTQPQWEIDRLKFIGRGGTIHHPKAMTKMEGFSNSQGASLDPIFSVRGEVRLSAASSETISFVTCVASSRERLERLMSFYFEPEAVKRTFEISLAHSDVEMRFEKIPLEKIHLYQHFSRGIFYHMDPYRPGLTARKELLLQQNGLWRFGISGDIPIVLIHVTDKGQLPLLRELLQAHHYLGGKGVAFDLVIVNGYLEGYRADFKCELEDMSATFDSNPVLGKTFLLNEAHVSNDEFNLLKSVANLLYSEKNQNLIPVLPKNIVSTPVKMPDKKAVKSTKVEGEECECYNGVGGFIDNGKAYQMVISAEQKPPMPWSNIVGAEKLGFLTTESGGGYTWSENSQSNRLTEWSCDPVTDPPSEMIYIRNRESGEVYSPLLMSGNSTVVEHHFGYSYYRSHQTELRISSSIDKCVKWWHLTFKNPTKSVMILEAYLVVDWVLGAAKATDSPFVTSSYDRVYQVLSAENRYNKEFSDRVAFIGSSETIQSFTTSRYSFFGRNRGWSVPVIFEDCKSENHLDNKMSSGSDLCGALEVTISIKPGEEKEMLFYMGEEPSTSEIKEASMSYKSVKAWHNEWEGVKKYWEQVTSTIVVETPERSMDILLNGWLLYQTLSCRMLARTAFYQSSGAFGFRDQLQDSMAMLLIDPDYTRKQILLHASHQFEEGDVQHWWHPPSSKGVRTRISDDYLWLPYAVIKYLEATGDDSILSESISYLSEKTLKDDEHEIYITPTASSEEGMLYEHCIRAIDRALEVGSHGLPLINGGDWNDGMNKVGVEGKGESVWLAWFLSDILKKFSRVCDLKKDSSLGESYKKKAEELLASVESNAWDGEWYRRAYFDDGTPLGTMGSKACAIDSLAQSWSVIANGTREERKDRAMQSVYKYLVDKENKLIKLLIPHFSAKTINPGYIASYPAGVRENGAQYTHAASWVIKATALQGDGDKAVELFQMINPINLTSDMEAVTRYQGEPYVVAADVYSVGEHAGKAGWTWYTGAAGWLYTVGIQNILGLKIEGDFLIVDPCIPKKWKEYKMTYRHRGVVYSIHVTNPDKIQKGVKEIWVDDQLSLEKKIPLSEKESVNVRVIMGS